MRILAGAIESETEELHRQGAQLRHIGDLGALDPDLQDAVRDAIELTRNNDRLVLTLAFNYGGRQEIIQAIQAMSPTASLRIRSTRRWSTDTSTPPARPIPTWSSAPRASAA